VTIETAAIAGSEQIFIYGGRVILTIIEGTAAGTAYAWADQHFKTKSPDSIDSCPPPRLGEEKVCHTEYGDFSIKQFHPGEQKELRDLPAFTITPIQSTHNPNALQSKFKSELINPTTKDILPYITSHEPSVTSSKISDFINLCVKFPENNLCKK